ncbi:MAG: hypothetical protein Kow00114_27280 [Kiloniellaceae bacterium]
MKVKLIRDRLTPTGPGVSIETVQGPLHVALLIAKLHEETQEIADSRCRDVDEYADALQALKDLARLHGIGLAEIVAAAADKEAARGGFLAGRVVVVSGAKPSNE